MFHLKQSLHADVLAHARPVTVSAERRRVLREILAIVGRQGALHDWSALSPVIEATLGDLLSA